MGDVTLNDATGNVLAQILARAITIAAQHPDVIAAVRAAFAPSSTTDDADPIVLVSKSELARRLGVSPATIDRHDRAGAPFEIVGSRKRYSVIARRAWLAKRGRFTTASAPKRDDIDVTDILAHSGLTVVTGGRR